MAALLPNQVRSGSALNRRSELTCHAVSRNELLLQRHLSHSQVLSFLSLEMIFTLLIGGLAVLVFWVSFVYRPRGTSRGPRRRRIP